MSTEAVQTQQTEAAPPPASPAAEPAEQDISTLSLDQRALLAIEHAQAKPEETEQPKAEAKGKAKAEPAKTEAPKEEPAPAETKTPEQIRSARQERLAAVEKMAEEERAKRVQQSRPTPERAIAAPQQAPGPKGFEVTDERSFFEVAEKLGLDPKRLGDWLSDPSKAQAAATKQALSPVEQRLAELAENQKRLEAKIARDAQAAHEAYLVEQNRRVLANHLETVKAEAPLSAWMLANKPAKFARAVDAICDGLPDGFTAQDVIDRLEEDLSDLQHSDPSPAPAAAPAPKQSKGPAAAKANVGNRLASERATTVDTSEEDEEGDLEARARKLKARLAAAG